MPAFKITVLRLPRLLGEPMFFIDRHSDGEAQVRLGPFMVIRERPARAISLTAEGGDVAGS